MTTINNIYSIPNELIIHVYNDLEKPADVICLASTCSKMLSALKEVKENTFFKEIVVQKILLNPWSFVSASLHPRGRKLEGGKALWENNLFGKIFCLKSQHLTCLPPASIRIRDFKLTLGTLNGFFSKCSAEEIEGSLRHDLSSQAKGFLELGNEIIKESQDHPTYKVIKEAYTDHLIAQKSKIGVRLLELCRPNSNSELTTAFLTVNSAKEELKTAKFLFITEISPEIDFEFACSLKGKHPHYLARVDFIGLSDTVQASHAKLREKSKALKAAEESYDDLKKEIKSLTESELNINKKIMNIDKTAMASLKTLACFYNELSKEITPENLKQRSRELHNVIG